MSYTAEQIAAINEVSTLKEQVSELQNVNRKLREQLKWRRIRIDLYKQELIWRNHGLHG